MADFKQITVAGVSHPVKDEVARQGLAGKQDKLTFDDTPTANSNNPVKSGGVYQAIQSIDVSGQISGKADKSEMSVVAGTGADADKTTITLKSGTSATVLTQHQDISGKEDKSNKVTSFSSPTDTQYPSAKLVNDQLATKQGTISDLATIRSGASAGATAYQKPGTGIPSTDLASAVQTSLGKADTAIQSVTVGTTTTGEAGTSASVVNGGTATAPVLNFTIPQGAQGVKGDTVIMGNEATYTLYNTTGDAVDGAMTQQAVTRELTELAGKMDDLDAELFVDSKKIHRLTITDAVESGLIYKDGHITGVGQHIPYLPVEKVTLIVCSGLRSESTTLAGAYLFDEDMSIIANFSSSATIKLSDYPTARYFSFNALAATVVYLITDRVSEIPFAISNQKMNNGYVTSAGILQPNDYYVNYEASVVAGSKITFPQVYSANAGYAFFDRTGAFVSGGNLVGSQGDAITLVVPNGCNSIKVSYQLNAGFGDFYIKEDLSAIMGGVLYRDAIIEHEDGTDLLTTFTENTYIDANGVKQRANGLMTTPKIYLKKNTDYYCHYLINGYYAFYDADGNVLESYGNGEGHLTQPFQVTAENFAYAIFTSNMSWDRRNIWLNTRNLVPSPSTNILYGVKTDGGTHCNYTGNEISVFNKIICVGDSLTAGVFNHNEGGTMAYETIPKYSYPTFLSKITGCDVTNKGIGGYTSYQLYEECASEDWSGHDCAIIQLGVNDGAQNSYNWTQQSIDGFTNIINKLKNENEGIKIFVATIIPAVSYSKYTYRNISDGIAALVESLADPNVILEDIATYGHTGDSLGYNCGHLSAIGYMQLAIDHKGLISYLIKQNLESFRKIQFIGTNMDYSDNS